ncbi:MAG TPA: molybdopterin-dependent oxidoreductase [Gemmatimonadaceae bacterium]|nr:molybdopterin-dependent oxidoreductase [Gemmatimonadaceae bacterium]
MSDTSKSTGVRRRDFLKVLGVAGATTATVGCGNTRIEHLIPYLVNPDDTVPGVSNYYASTCRECSAGCGVLMETRDGRTFKLEGNPAHPLNRGALCARGQAAVQGLYNPDRYRGPMVRQNGTLTPTTWAKALQLFSQKLTELQGNGQAARAVFINRHETGSFPAFLDEWLAAFGLSAHLSYDALANTAVIDANRQAYGVSWPWLDFSKAKLIVSFGADFLETWGANVPQQLDFADARAALEKGPRFVYVGARRSLTGLNADEWIACKPGSELAIVNALQGKGSLSDAATASDVPAATLQRLAREVAATKPSLFLAGGATATAAELARAVAALNQSAGNVGVTIDPKRAINSFEGLASSAELAATFERMRAGQVPLLITRGVNPAFTFPRAAHVAEAIQKVPFKVSFSSYPDETAELADLILPDHHAIESWGDAQPMPGVISMQQPGMDPVYDTRQTADVLIDLAKTNPKTAKAYAVPNYREWLIGHFKGGTTAFTKALETGMATGSVRQRPAAPKAAPPATPAPPAIASTAGDYYVVVYPSPALGDGSGANKPWLQEMPDPVSKICWQSWIEVHPSTAKKLGVEQPGDLLAIQTPSGTVAAPAYIYLGVRPDTVAIAFGQGHTAYGRYAEGTGVNAFDVIPVAYDPGSGALAWTVTKANVTYTGHYSELVTTEGSARQHGRGIARAMSVQELLQKRQHPEEAPPTAAEVVPGDASHAYLPGLRSPVAADAQGLLVQKHSKSMGMYAPDNFSHMADRRWAMTVDLARCTGCSACMTACYAENNIPTVGAAYQNARFMEHPQAGGNILRGREMTWIRIERYFEGGENYEEDWRTPWEARFTPMLCQHCGNAPCEPVCPVYATYHSPDGLNVQVYNRCVGTRYCSNNCPYKVRYFNWFGYGEPARPQYAWPEHMNWQLNPDVTVRGKGVMEKCTFCLQRIREAENRARAEQRELRPDEFTTSCAQACPSNAIVFGDAAHPQWSVTKHVEDERGYHVFQDELNTFPAVVYLQRVNHTEPAAPAAE